jgi:hypothetical protein
MGGSEIGGGGGHIFCNDPAHSEPFACSREAEGGWVCDAEFELEKFKFIAGYLYDALGPANDDIWTMAEEAWSQVCSIPDIEPGQDLGQPITQEELKAKYDIEYDSHE